MHILLFGLLGAALFGAASLLVRRFGGFFYARAVFSIIGGAACGVLCAQRFSPAGSAVTLVFLALLWAVAFIDLDTGEIPDFFHPPLLLCGLAACFLMPGEVWWMRALGMLCCSVPMLGISLLVDGAFGGGDLKLAFSCGLFLGLRLGLTAGFFAILFGGAAGAWLLVRRRLRRGGHFAFGPCMCAGILLAIFWGPAFSGWYLTLCGLT